MCAALERVAFDHGTERPFSGRTADGAPWHNKATGWSSLFPGDTLRTRCTCVLFCCTKTTPGTAQHAVSALDYTPSVQQPDRVQARPSCKTSRRFARRCTVRLTAGFYVGAVSGLPLFSSDAKFDSGSFVRSAVWIGLAAVEQLALLRALGSAWLGPKTIGCDAHEEWLTATATVQQPPCKRTPCSGHHATDTMQQTMRSRHHATCSRAHTGSGRPSFSGALRIRNFSKEVLDICLFHARCS